MQLDPVAIWRFSETIIFDGISGVENLVAYTVPGSGNKDEGYVVLRDLDDGSNRCVWDSQGTAGTVNFSPDGSQLVAALSTMYTTKRAPWIPKSAGERGEEQPYIFDTQTCHPLANNPLGKSTYFQLEFSDDGLYLLGTRYARKSAFVARIDGTEPVKWITASPYLIFSLYPLDDGQSYFVSNRDDHRYSAAIYTPWETKDLNRLARFAIRAFYGKNIIVEQKYWVSSKYAGPDLSYDKSRFVYVTPQSLPFEEPIDIYAVVVDLKTKEESHRWLLDRDYGHSVEFFPETSDIVLSLTAQGELLVHRLKPDKAILLIKLKTGLERGYVAFSRDGKLLVLKGKVLGSEQDYRISVYRANQFKKLITENEPKS